MTKIRTFKQFWRDDWQNLFSKYGIHTTVAEVLERWNQPNRFYHNQNHLYDLLSQIERMNINELLWEKLVLVAIFHDIIYHPQKSNNEEQSAHYLATICSDKNNPVIQEVVTAILDTKTHESSNKLSKIFNKLDMDIVTRDWEDLLEWENGIQEEYLPYFSKEKYKEGRINFLKSLISKYRSNKSNLKKLIEFVEKM